MLSCDADEGIIWLHPLFGATVAKEAVEKHSIVATIDDCDCFECECKRGPIDMLSTILVHLPTEYGMVTQRLTPSEAKALANALTSYANDINEFQEELQDG